MKNYSLLFIFLLLISHHLIGSHVTTGEINARHLSGNNYVITYTLLTDCAAISAPTSIFLTFTCGSTSFSSSLYQVMLYDNLGVNTGCDSLISNSYCNGGTVPGAHYNVYQDTVTLPNCGTWSISFSTCCRYPTNNITSTGSSSVFIESTINNQTFPTNSTPFFPLTPNLYVNSVDSFYIDYSAIDIDGDSLVYSFEPVKINATTFATYTTGYSGANPIQGFAIDPSTGVITKTLGTTPVGNYYLAVKVKEYDPISGVLKGEVQKELTVSINNFYSTPSVIANAPTPNGVQSITGATLVSSNTYASCGGSPIVMDLSFSGSQQVSLWSNISSIIPGSSDTVVEGPTSTMTVTLPTANLNPGKYTFFVQAIEDTCAVFSSMSYDVFTIIINGINAGQDQTICSGDSVQLTASSGSNYSSYQWSAYSGPTMTSGNSSCTNCANPIVSPTATTTYVVTGTGGTTCGNSDTITVFVDTPVSFNTIGSTNICSGDSITLDASGSVGPYYWVLNNFSTPFSTDSIITVSPTQNSTYFLQGDSNNMCINNDSVNIFVHQNTIASNDINICEGSSTTLSVSGGSTYSWTPIASLSCDTCSTTIASPLTTTTYVVTSNNTYCNNMDSVVVTVHNNTIASNDTVLCDGDSVMLTATGGTIFNWIPSLGLSCSNCPNPIASPNMNMTYYVTSNTNPVCSAVDTVNIIVEHDRVIHGTTYQSTGTVLPSTNVYMITYNPMDSSVTAIDSTTTTSNGEYNFTTTQSLVYLKVTPDSTSYPSLLPTYFNGQALFLNANSISANACDSIQANITTLQGFNPGGAGFISGNVYQGAGKTNGAGDPVGNLTLLLVNDQNQIVDYWITNNSGKIEFSNIPYGTYKIWVDKIGIDNSQAPIIKVNEFSNSSIYNFTLKSNILERSTPNNIDINDLSNHLTIYPNPTNSWINLNFSTPFTYELTNLNGSILKRSTTKQATYKINISNLPSGIYLIEIKTENQSIYKKIVKE